MTDRRSGVLLLISALTLAAARGEAETYRWVDEQGNVTYSNRPLQQREMQTQTPQPAPEAKSPAAKAPEVKPLETNGADLKTREPLPTGAKVTAPANPDAKPAESRPHNTRVSAPPAPIPKPGPTKVDELLEMAGVRAQLVGFISRIAADLRPAPAQMSAADRAVIDRVLAQSLRHDAIYAAVRDAFRETLAGPYTPRTDAMLQRDVPGAA